MAGNTNRDVKMTLSVETLGTEDIKKLQTSVAQLAKEGGDAAPEFQALADEISRLGDQSAALQAFQELAAETTTLVAKQEAAAASAEAYRVKLEALRAATAAATAAQAQAKVELEAARAAQNATRDELARLTAETSKAGKAEESYANQVRELKLAKIDQRAEVERMTSALTQSNTAVGDAERAEAKLEGTYNRAAKAAEAAQKAITGQQASLQESAAAAEALGISTDNVAASQGALLRSLNEAGQAALSTQASIDKLIRAEEELAAQNAFQKQADDAKRLFDTASYANLFDEALQRVAQAEREVAQAQAAIDWQREAEALVNAAEATQALTRQQEIMVEVQRQLAQDRALAQQAADAEKLADQAERIRLFTQVLDDLDEKERAAGVAAQEAGDKIKNAFGQVGVRSVEELRNEIVQVRAAMETLKGSAGLTGGALQQAFNSGNAKIKELERDIRAATGALTLADRAADAFKNSLGQIAIGNVIADGVGYLVNKVKELGSAFVDVTMKTETMRKGLQAVYGSVKTAADQFDFMRKTANDAGVSIGSINDAFLRFSAATKSANLPLKVTNDLFAAVTRAGATLGLTGEQVTGTLDALGQMASKGVVSMEELRQQLGDRLPGALSLSAKGLGITDQQLVKLVESGALATEDFFPAFTKGLQSIQGDTDTLSGAWQRFTNLLNTTAVAAGDAGGLNALKLALQGLAILVGVVTVPLHGFVEVLNLTARGIGVFYAKLTAKDGGKKALEDFGKEVEKSANRMKGLQDAVDTAISGGAAHVQSINASTVAQGQLSSAYLAAGAAADKKALADQNVSGAALGAGSAMVQLQVRMAEQAKQTETNIISAEKLARAQKDASQAVVQTAQLTANGTAIVEAHSVAAQAMADATTRVVAARQQEVSITQSAINQISALGAANGGLTAQQQARLTVLNQTLEKQTASLEQSRQERDGLVAQAAAAKLAADTYQTVGANVQAMGLSMDLARASVITHELALSAANATVLEYSRLVAEGKKTVDDLTRAQDSARAAQEALTRAKIEAGSAEGRYRAELQASVAAIERKARAQAADNNVTLAAANVGVKHYETLAALARANGNVAQAVEFEVQAKYKQIEATRIAQKIKNLELDAQIASIEVERKSITVTGEARAAKELELNTRLEVIKAKRIEAGASDDVVRGLESEIDAIRRRASASSPPPGAGGQGAPGGYGQGGGSRGPSGPESYVGADGLERRKSDGAAVGTFGNAVPLDKASMVRDRGAKAFGPEDIPMLREAVKQAMDAKQFIDATERSSAGSVSLKAITDTQGLVTATKNALAEAERKALAQKNQDAASTSHSLTIQLPNGTAGTFNMASAGDAQGITDLLAQLGNAKKVS